MQVGVFHMTTGGFRSGLDMAGYAARKNVDEAVAMVRKGIDENRYVLCAQVQADDMDEAYELTQNLTEEGWAAGPAVVFAAQHRDGKNRQRSSMVGDIFLFDGECYIIAACGFTKLPGLSRIMSDFGFDGRTGTAFDDSL